MPHEAASRSTPALQKPSPGLRSAEAGFNLGPAGEKIQPQFHAPGRQYDFVRGRSRQDLCGRRLAACISLG